MDLEDRQDNWTLNFQAGVVQLIQIDFRLSLVITDGADEVRLHIGTACDLKGPDVDAIIDPENTMSMSPALNLFNQGVKTINIEKGGHLHAEFEGGYSLNIDPNSSYEAWEIGCSKGFLMVCAPGGKVSFFEGRNRGLH